MSISSTSLYLIPSSGTVTVNTNLIADSRESLLIAQTSRSFNSTLTQATVTGSSPSVYTNLIADSQEALLLTVSSNTYTSTIKEATVTSPGIVVSNTPVSGTAAAQDSLNKVQIWSIS